MQVEEQPLTREQMVAAFNEWMQRFINEPAKFEAEFQSVMQFTSDQALGREQSYGENCVAYLQHIIEGGAD